MALPQFIFGGNTGIATPEELARQRALAEALLSRAGGGASSLGEGLGQLGAAIGGRIAMARADRGQKRADTAAAALWQRLLPGGGVMPQAVSPPDALSGGAGTDALPGGTNGDFIARMMPYAKSASQATGVDPRIILAQAALESAWGKKAPGNNFFGIKSHGKSGGQTFATTEEIGGKNVRIRDSFRTYGSPEDSFAGYADFINTNKRYRPLRGAKGLDAQIAALQASGYATDSKYGQKIAAIAKSIDGDFSSAPLGPMGTLASRPVPPQIADGGPQQPNIIPAGGPPPRVTGAGNFNTPVTRPMSAYDRMMQTAIAKGSLQEARPGQNPGPTGGFSPMAGMQAPPVAQAAPAPEMAATGAGPAPSRMQQILQAIGDPGFQHLPRIQQQFLLEEYQREAEAANPDPMKELQRQKLELEIEQMLQPKPGYRQLTPQEAQQRGLDPKKVWQLGPNNQLEAVGGGGINVDARQMGTVPPGYKANYDENGNVLSLEPIPGGPAAADAATAAAANDARKTAEQERGNIVTQDIDRALKVMEGGLLPDTGWGAYLSGVPGTDAKAVASLLDTIKANIGFGELNKMRQQSPTGGALGQVTEKELAFLQAVAGSLDQSQDAAQLTDNLNRLWNAYMDTIHGPGNGPPRRKLSFEGQGSGPAPATGGQPAPDDGPYTLQKWSVDPAAEGEELEGSDGYTYKKENGVIMRKDSNGMWRKGRIDEAGNFVEAM